MSIQTSTLFMDEAKKSVLTAGIPSTGPIHYQLSPSELIAATLRSGEGALSNTGALVIHTGQFTGRCPKDKFIVRDEITQDKVNWNEFNIPIEPVYFDIIRKKVMNYLAARPELWVRDCYACADERFRLPVRIFTEKPWSNLFAYNMFLRPTKEELKSFCPEWHVINVPELKLHPEECGILNPNVSIISFKHKMILIAGSGYTGEIKKGIFTILNYLLPAEKGVLSMHCSANVGKKGDTAIFFGLSGTGKTTLSTDRERKLIGDDEHGWTANNIFNFEGGCYAKCVNLTQEKEPDIFHAIRRGALVENVNFFPFTNKINFEDASITENTRVSYPLHFINDSQDPAVGGLPGNVFFLTCDAFGVLPPVSKLSAEQAMYQFISGYTAKIAGTENGVTEPRPTFSACFGAPFLPLHPAKYAQMLGNRMRAHKVNVWLVNTGWTGGPVGTGHRMELSHTRSIIRSVLENRLNGVTFETHAQFGFSVPQQCPELPSGILNPENTWVDRNAYHDKANYLAGLFIKNFEKYSSNAGEEIRACAPKII